MRILLDESLPRDLSALLVGHEAVTVRAAGWSGVKNGRLLAFAATRFDVFLTADRNIEYQQNDHGPANRCRDPGRAKNANTGDRASRSRVAQTAPPPASAIATKSRGLAFLHARVQPRSQRDELTGVRRAIALASS